MDKNTIYNRWQSIHQRCYNPKVKGYKACGEKGIGVDIEWHRDSSTGFIHFSNWFNKNLQSLPKTNINRLRVTRINDALNFGPNNCILVPQQIVSQSIEQTVLSFELVVQLRQHKKTNPLDSTYKMSELFGVSPVNISRALRGVTWGNVNAVESPIITV